MKDIIEIWGEREVIIVSQVSRAIIMLKGILNGSDRIGSDEIYDIGQVINVLKTINGDK